MVQNNFYIFLKKRISTHPSETCDKKLWQNSSFAFQGYTEPLSVSHNIILHGILITFELVTQFWLASKKTMLRQRDKREILKDTVIRKYFIQQYMKLFQKGLLVENVHSRCSINKKDMITYCMNPLFRESSNIPISALSSLPWRDINSQQ